MNSKISDVICQLEAGVLPLELNFNQDYSFDNKLCQIGNTTISEELISKIQYNSFYKSFDYWADKFPDGFLNLPGADKIINHLQENSLTPLEELNLRKTIISDNNIDDKEFSNPNDNAPEDE